MGGMELVEIVSELCVEVT